jgi:5-formyltetrahydrofolate cyclo-ligase
MTYPLLAIFTSRKIMGEWKIVSLDREEADDEVFSVIVVPTLGFDDSLNRLGYGGGYYDRFLAKQRDALKIGLCYEEGHVKKIPIEKHDIPLDCIISEKRVYTGIIDER